MATIALYSNKTGQMPGLIGQIKQSVIDYKTELYELSTKGLTISSNICDLEDVIVSIQSSTQIQEEKISSLETIN